ncbi:MAG: ATPase [Alphaproteobacteria bacterium TMED89]|nr:MAG: ATPase [Alphaproteobacteria bacterium TMED89]RPH18610.1 MAG: ATPase [Alphaproteobacteria bacterium TMED89]
MQIMIPQSQAFTLLGMSGVGKTTLALKLPRDRWFHYSGDYRIGTRYLGEAIQDDLYLAAMQQQALATLLKSDSIYIRSNISMENLAPLSAWIGTLGRKDQGGHDREEFARRQRLHEQAEIAALLDVGYFMDRASTVYGYDHFLVDAGGSLIEVVDLEDPANDPVLRHLSQRTQLVYIEAADEHVEHLIERTIAYPKPMFYRTGFLDAAIAEYSAETGLRVADDFPPLEFVKWVFPHLIRARRDRYDRLVAAGLARRVAADDIARVETEADFLDLVEQSK